MSKEAGTTSTTSTTNLPSFQQPHAERVLDEAFRLYKTGGPKYYPGERVAGLTPDQIAAQEMVRGYVPQSLDFISKFIMPSLSSALKAPDLENNPWIEPYAEAATRPITENLTENILPSIRAGYLTGGGYGGSRQGVAEGIAIGKTNQALADARSKIYSDAYNTGLSTMLSGLNLFPSIQSASYAPAEALATVGGQNRELEQAKIDAEVEKFMYGENLPYQTLTEYSNVAKLPFGGASETKVEATPADNLSQVFSLILGGLGLAPSIIGSIIDIFRGGD